jgi:hypothetical protein
MQTSTEAGSAHSDVTAVAVMPYHLPPLAQVMTLTVVANLRIDCRKVSLKSPIIDHRTSCLVKRVR